MPTPSFSTIGFNRARLISRMNEKNLEGVFLSTPENVFYTTGYPCLPSSGNPIIYALRNQLPFFSYCGRDGNLVLLGWAQASMGIDYDVDDLRTWFTYPFALDELTTFVQEKIKAGSLIGVDSDFPFFLTQIIQDQIGMVKLVIIDDVMHELQLIKTAAEIARIRMATAIVDKALLQLVDCLHSGMTRLELIREAKTRMLQNGADGVDHVTVAFGSANPEIALDEPIEENQIVTLDLGAIYGGYISDNRRLVYTGKIPAELSDLHKKMCNVVDLVGSVLQPGKSFGEMHALATELYSQYGLEPMFLHVGHSIGLHVDEHWMLPDDPTRIEENMVLNIELYSLSDDGVLVGNEETYVVTGGAPEKMSSLAPAIIEKKL